MSELIQDTELQNVAEEIDAVMAKIQEGSTILYDFRERIEAEIYTAPDTIVEIEYEGSRARKRVTDIYRRNKRLGRQVHIHRTYWHPLSHRMFGSVKEQRQRLERM